MKDGFGAPFVRVFYKGVEISDPIDRMKYCFDEEDDDELELEIKTADRNAPDKPEYQEDVELEMIWGFIGGEVSEKRIVTIRNVKPSSKNAKPGAVTKKGKNRTSSTKPSFNKDLLTITLVCTEKGTNLKGASDKVIYKGKNILQVAQDKANKHGLKAYVEIPNQPPRVTITAIPGETTDQFLIREYDANWKAKEKWLDEHPKERQKVNLEFMNDWKNTNNAIDDPDLPPGTAVISQSLITKVRSGLGNSQENAVFNKWLSSFYKYRNLPQAGKSDKQLLDDMARREQNGPYLAETRDGNITIRKRNFDQAPYKLYEYGGSQGDLLEFTPEYKNRSKRGASIGMGFGGWDAANKQFFKGKTESDLATNDASLAKAIKMRDDYKGISQRGGGSTRVGVRLDTHNNRTFLVQRENVAISSNTLISKQPTKVPVTVDDRLSALQKAIQEHVDAVNAKHKTYYDSLGLGPGGALNNATNLRNNAELNTNPATLQTVGDPHARNGVILTITGVSKKYSGNYYIKKVTHMIDHSGYFCDWEGVRQGHNLVGGSSVDARSVGRKVNNQIGVIKGAMSSITLPTKSNLQKIK